MICISSKLVVLHRVKHKMKMIKLIHLKYPQIQQHHHKERWMIRINKTVILCDPLSFIFIG